MNTFYVKNTQTVQVLKALYLKIMILVSTPMLLKWKKKKRNKCFSIVRFKPNIKPNGLSQFLAETRRILYAKNNKPPEDRSTESEWGSCGYYDMDENVTMTN